MPSRYPERRGRSAAWLSALLALLAAVVPAAAQPAPATQPADAKRPNVLVVLIDDGGFTDLGPYGGEARTPNIDRLAERGALFTSHHSSPLCSPSRAMLLTGIDNHRTGVATIEEVIPPEHEGQPGYTLHLEPGVETVATRLKRAGYRTYMAGKWHLGHGPGDLPNAHGFDRSLALDASGADNWAPKPYMPYYADAPWFEDGEPARMPESYYSSELLVDRLIQYLTEDQGRSEPFFAYLSYQAVHIPVQAPGEITARYAGRFDAGWEVVRRERWRRARALGIIPIDAPLGPIPPQLRSWALLTDDERQIYAKSMAVYAAMIEALDHHLGRLLAWLDERGELENTLVIVTSDNGPEPSDPVHAPGMNVWMALHGYSWELDNLGERGSLNFIGPEWATAAGSPGSLFKFYTTEGGIRVPLVIAGPGVTPGTRVRTPTFVTDVTPTILEIAGVSAEGGGVPITGRSLGPVLRGEAERAHPVDAPVGVEVAGNAALFKGDMKLVRNMPPWGDGAWHLYDIARDPGETEDLSASRPELVAEMLRDYEAYMQEMGVLPMPEGYDVQRQIIRNSIKRQVQHNMGFLAVVAAVLLAAAAFVVRRRRRTRHARAAH
ncbi:MAG TPA: arylsulfatase [Candidatus Binatia bacterium]